MPFRQLDGDDEPRIDLRQIGPNAFQLLEGFRYVEPGSEETPYVVPAHDPTNPADPGNRTDLASVPTYLWWFIASHGKQTRPALMHDHLVNEIDRSEADRLFRVSLEEVGVSWIRRWLMWTAVGLATMKQRSLGRVVAFSAHLTAFVLALTCWAAGWALPAVGRVPGWLMLLLGLSGFVWGIRWPWSVAGVLLLAPATVLVWVTTWVVWVLELGAWSFRRMQGAEAPRPAPVPFREQSEEY